MKMFSFSVFNMDTQIDSNDSTQNLLKQMKSHAKGLANVNYTEEFNPNLTEKEKKGLKRFLVFRSNPQVIFFGFYFG